jgi:hypothetical protein
MFFTVLTFIITNLNNGTAPYNITIPSNPADLPNLILQNYPWFFPLITMFLFGISEYLISLTAQIDNRTNLLAVALAYTIVTYAEVSGSLTTIGWFAVFEVITIAVLFIISLFVPQGEP